MGRRDGGHARRGVSDSRRGAEAAKGGERRGNGASPAGVLTAATTAPPAGGAHWGGPPATAGMGSACVGHARRRGASTQHPAIHCGTGTTPLGTGTGAGGREGGKGGVRGGEGGSPLLKGGGECCPSAPRTGVARSHTLDTARRARPCGASRRAERRARAWRPPPARPLSVRVDEGPTNEGRPRVAAVGGHLRRRDGRRGRRVCSSQCEKSGRRGPLARAPGRGRDAARPHTGVGGSPPRTGTDVGEGLSRGCFYLLLGAARGTRGGSRRRPLHTGRYAGHEEISTHRARRRRERTGMRHVSISRTSFPASRSGTPLVARECRRKASARPRAGRGRNGAAERWAEALEVPAHPCPCR